jgi:hypothetical protein
MVSKSVNHQSPELGAELALVVTSELNLQMQWGSL